MLGGDILPPNASESKSGMSLQTSMQELHAEPAGRKPVYISPAVSPPNAGAGPWEARKGISVGGAAMLMPLRASQDPSGRRSSLPFMSPKGMAPGRRSSLLLSPLQGMELLAPHKSLSSFFNRIPSERAVAFGSVPAFPAGEASVARTRSLESTFGWARPGEYALRREVAVPERPAGSLEPLRERRSSLGRSRPLGFLRKSTRAEFAVRAPSTLRFISLLGSPRCGQAFLRGTDSRAGVLKVSRLGWFAPCNRWLTPPARRACWAGLEWSRCGRFALTSLPAHTTKFCFAFQNCVSLCASLSCLSALRTLFRFLFHARRCLPSQTVPPARYTQGPPPQYTYFSC